MQRSHLGRGDSPPSTGGLSGPVVAFFKKQNLRICALEKAPAIFGGSFTQGVGRFGGLLRGCWVV